MELILIELYTNFLKRLLFFEANKSRDDDDGGQFQTVLSAHSQRTRNGVWLMLSRKHAGRQKSTFVGATWGLKILTVTPFLMINLI